MGTSGRAYAERLHNASLLTGPAIKQAIDVMALPPGSRGLDAGCGVGLHAIWLAEKAGEARVVGVDLSEENLAVARENVAASGVSDRIELERHNVLELDFPNDSFDWAWSADLLYPLPAMEHPLGLRELARVVRPGGKIGVAFWSSQQLLAGHPLLETRLHEAHTARNPYLGRIEPALHFLRARGWMREVGLSDIETRTFVSEIVGPIEGSKREALAFWLDMFYGDLKGSVDANDWTDYLWFADPVSASFIGDEPDYYGFITYTLFLGTVPSR